MTQDDERRFAELRGFLSKWALSMLRNPTEVEDLVHDTIERVLSSDTAAKIKMNETELRGFAFTAMDRLAKNRRRATWRHGRALASYADFCVEYDDSCVREVEIEDCLRSLGPRDRRALVVIADSGLGAIDRLTEEPGLSARDLPRLRKKIKLLMSGDEPAELETEP